MQNFPPPPLFPTTRTTTPFYPNLEGFWKGVMEGEDAVVAALQKGCDSAWLPAIPNAGDNLPVLILELSVLDTFSLCDLGYMSGTTNPWWPRTTSSSDTSLIPWEIEMRLSSNLPTVWSLKKDEVYDIFFTP